MPIAATNTLARLRPKQREGLTWMARGFREYRALGLFDDPGLGKTLQTLALVDVMGWSRVCVAAPAGARRVWRAQILTWFPEWRDRIVIIEPGRSVTLAEAAADQAIVLVAYDTLSGRDSIWTRQLASLAWDLLVIDEAHYLKNHSQRTRAVYGSRGDNEGIQASAEHVLLLTGTPTPNNVGELWQHMRSLWPHTLHSLAQPDRAMVEDEWVERTCLFRDGPYGRQIVGSTDAGKRMVRERLGRYVRRVSKAEALPELPPVTEQDVPLALSPTQVRRQLPAEVRHLETQLCKLDEDQLWRAMNRAPATGDDNDERQPISTLRRVLGEQKIPGTVEWVVERLSCGAAKLLVFGWHVRALETLHTLLAEHEPVLITGRTRPEERVTLIERFQTRPACRVFIGQIQAAGTAITLTAASEVVIFEPSWVPGDNRQAIDRAHRMGQRAHVLAHYLVLPGTLDEKIIQVMRRKELHTRGLFTKGNDEDDDRRIEDQCAYHAGVELRGVC